MIRRRLTQCHRYIPYCAVLMVAAVMMSAWMLQLPPVSAEEVFNASVIGVDQNENDQLSSNLEESIFQMEIIRDGIALTAHSAPKVLIYHTHTYEAYEQTGETQYKQTEKWRTSDSSHNVVAVGKALAGALRSLGIDVVHDTTAFEPPNLDDAYGRSLSMLENRLENGELYDLYIDLHRDALAASSTIKRTVNIGGEEIARFMVLVGKGTTGGYQEKPDWETNILFAQRITDHLNELHVGLARDVKIKTGRFNQHISDGCILIECGMNTNTLAEVLAGIPYLAEAISATLVSTNE